MDGSQVTGRRQGCFAAGTDHIVYTYVTVWCDFYGCFGKGKHVVLQVVKGKTRFLLLQKVSIMYLQNYYLPTTSVRTMLMGQNMFHLNQIHHSDCVLESSSCEGVERKGVIILSRST